MRPFLPLLGFLALAFVAAALGGVASISAGADYAALRRPDWAPPGWLFGPVWTTLYVMMAVAAWLVWRDAGWGSALTLWIAQLALNALWTWIFFAWQARGWAVVEIVALWLVLAATLVAFWRVRAIAGALLVPYLAWVSFATALSVAIWRRN